MAFTSNNFILNLSTAEIPTSYSVSVCNAYLTTNTSPLIFTVTTNNVPIGTNLYWYLSNTSSNVNTYNFTSNTLSGYAKINGAVPCLGTNTVTLGINQNVLCRANAGPKQFTFNLLGKSNTGPVVTANASLPGIPYSPTINVAIACNTTNVNVYFTPPCNANNAVITNYNVTSHPCGNVFSGNTSPILVTNLDSNTAYTFSVTATNYVGNSRQSNNSNFINPNTMWAWGWNGYGGLGLNNFNNASSPTQVSSSVPWAAIATQSIVGSWGIKADGTLWYAGYNPPVCYAVSPIPESNTTGRFNSYGFSSWLTFGQVTNYTDWCPAPGKFSVGASNSVTNIKKNGTLWSDGGVLTSNRFSQIGSLTNWCFVSVGGGLGGFSVKTDGSLWVWGDNYYGALGIPCFIGCNTNRLISSPIQIGSCYNWAKTASGCSNGLAIKKDGTLWAWGYCSSGVLGQGSSSSCGKIFSTRVQIGSCNNWKCVAISGSTSVGIKTDGTMWAWGYNGPNSLLGTGDTTNRSSPVQIGGLNIWKRTAIAGNGVALTSTGKLYAWGTPTGNGHGPCGNWVAPFSGIAHTPTQIGTGINWINLDYGTQKQFAISKS